MADGVTQCAWCRRYYNPAGYVEAPLLPVDVNLNHGICFACLDDMLRKEVERYHNAGEHAEARLAQVHRSATSSRLARQRADARTKRDRAEV